VIELVGGPFDGARPRSNTKFNEIGVGAGARVLKPDRKQGIEARYFEERVCTSCGVRAGESEGLRRFIHESMRCVAECELCGNETMNMQRMRNARQD
jgi:hypothetical protein